MLSKNKFIALVFVFAGVLRSQIPDAPPRPNCTSIDESGPGTCGFNPSNGVGPGDTVLLVDFGSPRGRINFRNSLERLRLQYGFEVVRADSTNDITDENLKGAKVVIFNGGDGEGGGALPTSDTVRARVEDFVNNKGWGIITIHTACAFVGSWEFFQDVCIQQYFHDNASNTQAEVYVEDRTVDDTSHGRANPYSNFLLRGLPDRVTMRDGWITWRGNPRTTHQYNRQSKNKNMLLAVDENTFNATQPNYPDEHYIVWTHTMGPADGVAINYSMGVSDVYQQDGDRRAYGDSLMWRLIRYAAKDWGESTVPAGKRNTSISSTTVTAYPKSIQILFNRPGQYRIRIMGIKGNLAYAEEGLGDRVQVEGLQDGIYVVEANVSGIVTAQKVAVF